ncbi:MAG: hypothetical protein U1A27_08285 [Phycisphaerae bacterium]
MAIDLAAWRDPRRRALFVTSVVFGASLGIAWRVSQARNEPLPLGQRVAPPGWPVTFQLPDGWHFQNETNDRGDPQVVATGPGRGMQVTIRRERHQRAVLPADVTQQAVLDDVGRLAPEHYESETIAVGPLAGNELQVDFLTMDGGAVSAVLAAATLPDGTAVVVKALGESRRSGANRRAVESICRSIEVVEPTLSRSAPGGAKLKCDVPKGAWAATAGPEGAHLVMLADGDAAAPWRVVAWSTRLLEGRTLEALAVDRLLTEDLESARYEPVPLAGGAVRRAVMFDRRHGEEYVACAAADLGDGRVGMVLGRGGTDVAEAIRAACMTVVASLSAGPEEPVDWAAARRRGAAAVAAALRHAPGEDDAQSTQRWVMRYRGEPTGAIVDSRGPHEGQPGSWEGLRTVDWRPLPRWRMTQQLRWVQTRANGALDATIKTVRELPTGDQSHELKLVRTAGSEGVVLSENIGGRTLQATVAPLDAFVLPWLRDETLAALRDLPAGESALLAMVDVHARAPAWFAVRRGAGDGTVFDLTCDFDETPVRVELDRAGHVRREVLEEALEIRRASAAELRRRLKWFEE